MARVTDLTNAQDVILAHEMARMGATPQLLERLTGFGARWARAVVKEECGVQPAHRRKDDPAVWFERDSERILHGFYVVKAYRCTNHSDHRASRLLDAYRTYREMPIDPILDINHCAEIIELAETGMAWERTCSSCRVRHLVVTEHTECPVCRRLQAMLCRGCGAVLPEPSQTERRGRPRLYCSDCETNRSSRVLKTTRDRKAHIHQAVSSNPAT